MKRTNTFKLLIFFVTVFLMFSGCRKYDTLGNDAKTDYEALKAQFFNTATTNDIEIQNLAKDIKRQDSLFKFLPAFVKKNGIPKWDKVYYKTENRNAKNGKPSSSIIKGSITTLTEGGSGNTNSQGVFFIPLQSTTSPEIKSYITAYKHNDSLYTYRLYNKDSLDEIHTTSVKEKSNLLTTQAVFGFFEKAVNNNDSVSVVTSTKPTTIKNVSIKFNDQKQNAILSDVAINSFPQGSCDMTISVTIEFAFIEVYNGSGQLIYGAYYYSETLTITISCTGGGGGDCGCGSCGTPSTGGNNPSTGGSWWGSGTGWPWNNPGYYAGYDPNNPNPNNPGWGWWWNGGSVGGGNNPFAGKPLAPATFQIDHYWEDPAYDNNSYTFPTCTDPASCAYDQDGYRKNGPIYNYNGGTVQNYTNNNGGQYAIFTKTNGDKTKFPDATITDFGVAANKGATTSNGGIHADLTFGLSDLQHEYGHYLQAQHYGSFLYNTIILPASFWDASINTAQGHRSFWTEVEANQFSISFFGSTSDIALDPINFPR